MCQAYWASFFSISVQGPNEKVASRDFSWKVSMATDDPIPRRQMRVMTLCASGTVYGKQTTSQGSG